MSLRKRRYDAISKGNEGVWKDPRIIFSLPNSIGAERAYLNWNSSCSDKIFFFRSVQLNPPRPAPRNEVLSEEQQPFSGLSEDVIDETIQIIDEDSNHLLREKCEIDDEPQDTYKTIYKS
ncbi:hypothetical protein NPIL_408841 [Nephila pilipes]|uniref:Uncharacterized protein n=1 Tax=Nephila pilipes TaxID=299642 RepID=A0A8X6TKE5_NEPPI|nr:hypothetical protein NPIL_408841 [Nephila pilipes]